MISEYNGSLPAAGKMKEKDHGLQKRERERSRPQQERE